MSADDFYAYQYAAAQLDRIDDPSLLVHAPFSELPEDKRPMFRRAALSLGLERAPLLTAAIEGVRGSITSQIAVQMSFRAVLERCLEFYQEQRQPSSAERALATELVREGFKEANRQVYEYAHKMGAGGRVSATGFISCYDGKRFSVARVGAFDSFIWRQGEFSPLYEASSATTRGEGVLQRFIGANSQILVDLASVTVQEGDVLVLTSLAPGKVLTETAEEILRDASSAEDVATRLAHRGFWLSVLGAEGERYSLDKNIFTAVLSIGRPTIKLTRIVEV